MLQCFAKKLGTRFHFSTARQTGHNANIKKIIFWRANKPALGPFSKGRKKRTDERVGQDFKITFDGWRADATVGGDIVEINNFSKDNIKEVTNKKVKLLLDHYLITRDEILDHNSTLGKLKLQYDKKGTISSSMAQSC